MKNNRRFSTLVLLLLLLPFYSRVMALSLVDVDSTLTDVFSTLVDDNEGSTSFRSLLIPIGGRAESLGTAYTGLSDDISFFDYNASASSVLTQTEISLFHNQWISDSAIESAAATTRFGNLGLGASIKCFYVPFSEYNIFGEKVAANYYSETTAALNISYNFLAGYTFKGIAIGANLKSSFRSVPDYTDDDTNAIISGSGLSQSAIGFMGDFGMLLRFNFAKFYSSREPNLRVGLSLTNAGVAFTGFGEGLTLDDPLPTRASIGVSYKFIKPVTITAEFRQPIDLLDIGSSGLWSAGAGTQVQITDFFAVIGGFLLQGGNPRISLGSEFTVKGVKMNVNYTFDLTSSANPVNHISLSAKMLLGDRGRAQKQKQVDDLYRQGLIYYAQSGVEKDQNVASEYMDKAVEVWQEALALDAGFDPARTGISVIQREKANLRKVQEEQTLE